MFSLMRDLLDDEYYSPRYNSVPAGLLLPNLLDTPRVHYHLAVPRRQQSTGGRGDGPKSDGNQFQVMLNVKQFRPEEIDVKVVDDCVVIHGKHEEHADEHGFVSREFTRRYKLPEDVEPDTIKSSFSQNGILAIRAPRKQLEPPPKNERIVPITIQQPAAVEEAQKQQQQQQDAAQQQPSSEEKMEQ